MRPRSLFSRMEYRFSGNRIKCCSFISPGVSLGRSERTGEENNVFGMTDDQGAHGSMQTYEADCVAKQAIQPPTWRGK